MNSINLKTVNACVRCDYNCMGCFHAGECGDWLDTDDGIPTIQVPCHMSMALCEGRHNIPQAVDGAIFDNTINPLDIDAMANWIPRKIGGIDSLDLYVTGLTVALVEVIKYCNKNNVDLTLYHFDRESGSYYKQEVK